MKNPLLKITLAALSIYATQKFCYRQTDGFQISKTISMLSPSPNAPITDEISIQQTLNQPFSYLGSGGQCYAFLSQDKKTVLKLFKMHHLRQYNWLQHISLPGQFDYWRLKFIAHQKQKIERYYISNTLAWDALREESGLIHICLNPSSVSPLTTTLIDKLHITHSISLRNIPFVLQHYAENPFKKLRHHISRKETTEAKKIVKSIVDTLSQRYKKGIADLDPALRRNIGMLDEKVIFIDTGAFISDAQTDQQKELLWKETRRMDRWLNKRSPELKRYLDQLIADQNQR